MKKITLTKERAIQMNERLFNLVSEAWMALHNEDSGKALTYLSKYLETRREIIEDCSLLWYEEEITPTEKKRQCADEWLKYERNTKLENKYFQDRIECSFYYDMEERYWGRYYSPNEDEEDVAAVCDQLWEEHQNPNPIYDDEWMWDDCLAWMADTKPIRDKAEWDAVHDEMPVVFDSKYSIAPELFKDPSRHWRAVLLLYKYYYACVDKFIVRWDDTYDPLPF